MNTILLGNLIKIRWIAIFGQALAIFFVSFVIKIQISFFETLTIILLSKLLGSDNLTTLGIGKLEW